MQVDININYRKALRDVPIEIFRKPPLETEHDSTKLIGKLTQSNWYRLALAGHSYFWTMQSSPLPSRNFSIPLSLGREQIYSLSLYIYIHMLMLWWFLRPYWNFEETVTQFRFPTRITTSFDVLPRPLKVVCRSSPWTYILFDEF